MQSNFPHIWEVFCNLEKVWRKCAAHFCTFLSAATGKLWLYKRKLDALAHIPNPKRKWKVVARLLFKSVSFKVFFKSVSLKVFFKSVSFKGNWMHFPNLKRKWKVAAQLKKCFFLKIAITIVWLMLWIISFYSLALL